MKKLILQIKSFVMANTDKFFLHFPLALLLTLNVLFPLWEAVLLTAILCVLKELYDKYIKKSYWSWGDIYADLAGILLGIILRLYYGQ